MCWFVWKRICLCSKWVCVKKYLHLALRSVFGARDIKALQVNVIAIDFVNDEHLLRYQEFSTQLHIPKQGSRKVVQLFYITALEL